MRIQKYEVTRKIEVPGENNTIKDQERKTTVSFRVAETIQDATEIVAELLEKANKGVKDDKKKKDSKDLILGYFNSGRWADMRVRVSNKLAGKSEGQKNFDRMVKAYSSIMPNLGPEEIKQIVLGVPGMKDVMSKSADGTLPAETSESDFVSDDSEPEATTQAA